MAHPKGSHKLEGVDGDAVVETIVDQQEKDKAVVDHKPTGKLATSLDILNKVKIVLAQAAPTQTKEELENSLESLVKEANRVWTIIDNKIQSDGGLVNGIGMVGRGFEYSIQAKYISDLLVSRPITLDSLKSIKNRVGTLQNIIKPGVSWSSLNPFGGVSDDVHKIVSGNLSSLIGKIDKAYQLRSKIAEITSQEIEGGSSEVEGGSTRSGVTTEVVHENTAKVFAKIDKEITSLQNYKRLLNLDGNMTPAEKKEAFPWLDQQIAKFTNIKNSFNDFGSAENKETNAPAVWKKLNPLIIENQDFAKEWLA